VTSYQEGEAHTAFVTGNAAFMRNWPYAYSIAADPKQSKVVGKFSVTTLPKGPGGHPVGTVGGWQLAVNKYSKHPDAAVEFVRYMTSPAVEKFDAITNTNVPTIPSVAKDPAVVKANPYLKPQIATVARVTRPARYLGTHYNERSKYIYQGVSQILNGAPASSVLPGVQSRLDRLVK
jgi:trehalose/maltose transport system substrate-binding protein